jgi:hypothetical protein
MRSRGRIAEGRERHPDGGRGIGGVSLHAQRSSSPVPDQNASEYQASSAPTVAHPKPIKRVRAAKPLKRSGPPHRSKRPRRASAKRPSVVKADAAWAKAVREKYGDRCFHFWCTSPAMDTHHIIGKKAHPRLRYVVENGLAMCREHHNEAHVRPVWFKENFRGWYHERWYGLLVKARG